MTEGAPGGVLLVSWGPGELRAILKVAGRAVELGIAREHEESLVGAIYLARVTRIVPALPGAFVDIGPDSPAFLPGQVHAPEGSALMVQIVKDARQGKPPEVRAAPSLRGHYLDFTGTRSGMRFPDGVSGAARTPLTELFTALLGSGEGLTIHAEAMERGAPELTADLEQLRARWAAIATAAQQANAPARLDRRQSMLERLLGQFELSALERIVIDDAASAAELRRLFGEGHDVPVELDARAGLFAAHDVEDAFDRALEPRVTLPGGGELVIETTEAATLIDVNLGSGTMRRQSAAGLQLEINLKAAEEIARQMRLRDLAGAIIIDFISMRAAADRARVSECLMQAVAVDSVPVGLHGWTRLGHFELTRQRRRRALADILLEPQMPARGKSAETTALEALRLIASGNHAPGRLVLSVSPAVADLLGASLADAFALASRRAGRNIRIEARADYPPDRVEIATG